MLDFAPRRMSSAFVATTAILLVFQFGRGLFIDPSLVVLHLAVLTSQINIGVFSSRHN